jgi:hypothetical protein
MVCAQNTKKQNAVYVVTKHFEHVMWEWEAFAVECPSVRPASTAWRVEEIMLQKKYMQFN